MVMTLRRARRRSPPPPHRHYRRAIVLSLGGVVLAGCHLLLDDGDKYLRADDSGTGGDGPTNNDAGADITIPTTESGGSDADAETSTPDCIPIDAGSPVRVLARGQQLPGVIRADDTYVFWVNDPTPTSPGSIMRLPVSGLDELGKPAQPTTLVTGLTRRTAIATSSTFVLFAEEFGGTAAGIFKVPKAGGPSTIVDDDGLGTGSFLMFRNAFLYGEAWSPTSLARVRKTGLSGPSGCTPYITTTLGARLPDVQADDFEVFIIDTARNAIMRAPIGCNPDGGPGEATVFAPGQGDALVLANDDRFLFWLTKTTVYRQEKYDAGTTATPTVRAQNGKGITDLALVPGAVVYVDNVQGTVMHTSFTNGVRMLANCQGGPYQVVDANNILYWTNRNSGEVMSMAIPAWLLE
jgi:hypothetical protein